MKLTSFQENPIQELENEIIETKENSFSPTLAILFDSVDCDPTYTFSNLGIRTNPVESLVFEQPLI